MYDLPYDQSLETAPEVTAPDGSIVRPLGRYANRPAAALARPLWARACSCLSPH
jgi:hypothetical protein